MLKSSQHYSEDRQAGDMHDRTGISTLASAGGITSVQGAQQRPEAAPHTRELREGQTGH